EEPLQQTIPAATLEKPPKAEEKAKPIKDPIDGTAYATLRGLKKHVTQSHKLDWDQWCSNNGLDEKTGLPNGAPSTELPSTTPSVPPTASPQICPMFGQAPPPPPPAPPGPVLGFPGIGQQAPPPPAPAAPAPVPQSMPAPQMNQTPPPPMAFPW